MSDRSVVMRQEVAQIVSAIAEVSLDRITEDADFRNGLGIDSMMGLEIMYTVEKKYNIHLREEDLPKMRTLRSLCKLIEEHRV